MNFSVANPEWGWWIIGYFFLGGIAAGSYFTATLIELFGAEEDRELPRIGYWLALPLITLCGVFLILDLHRPERFWHMLFASDQVQQALADGWPTSEAGWKAMLNAPILKRGSPMSAGSWALTVFGLCSSLSLLGSLQSDGFLPRLLRRGILGRLLQVVGCLAGFFVASYTGSLLTATNQPMWSDTVWIASLFLASAASTSIAAMLLIARALKVGSPATLQRLEHADIWALGLELVIFAVFLGSLSSNLGTILQTMHGKLLVFGVLLFGVLLPLALHLRITGLRNWNLQAAAVCALVGGFILRYAILETPPELLKRGPTAVSPANAESGRLHAEVAPPAQMAEK